MLDAPTAMSTSYTSSSLVHQQSGRQTGEDSMHFQPTMVQWLGIATTVCSPVVGQLITVSIRQVHVLSMHGASRVSGGTGRLPK